ncbi:hypothetical protein LX90_009132 [Lentzea flava]|nr:hypothetical protein [Lentzea flava]
MRRTTSNADTPASQERAEPQSSVAVADFVLVPQHLVAIATAKRLACIVGADVGRLDERPHLTWLSGGSLPCRFTARSANKVPRVLVATSHGGIWEAVEHERCRHRTKIEPGGQDVAPGLVLSVRWCRALRTTGLRSACWTSSTYPSSAQTHSTCRLAWRPAASATRTLRHKIGDQQTTSLGRCGWPRGSLTPARRLTSQWNEDRVRCPGDRPQQTDDRCSGVFAQREGPDGRLGRRSPNQPGTCLTALAR